MPAVPVALIVLLLTVALISAALAPCTLIFTPSVPLLAQGSCLNQNGNNRGSAIGKHTNTVKY